MREPPPPPPPAPAAPSGFARVRSTFLTILYPRVAFSRLPIMLAIAFSGAAVAGLYGALHDQISYAISPEYFTKMKFQQFHWADAGWSPRVFASIVGFLATWWAGFFAGWFMARAGLDRLPSAARRRTAIGGFAIALGCTAACGALGALIGHLIARGNLDGWEDWRERLSLQNVPGFVTVAWLHASGYIGALVGLIAAIIYVRRRVKVLAPASVATPQR